MLIKVNKYVDYEFRIYKFLILIFIVVVCKKKVNKLMNIQNEPRSQLPTGIIGKQVC